MNFFYMLKSTISIFLLLNITIINVHGNEEHNDDVVKSLTFSDFMPTLENNKNVLVEFYAPWCGHCKAFEPKFKAAAEIGRAHV